MNTFPYVSSQAIIDLLAPMVGVNPNDVRSITVSANYIDGIAVFNVELVGRQKDEEQTQESQP